MKEYLVSVQKMREIEELAEQQYGITGRILMENAGRMAAEAIISVLSTPKEVVLLCGCGNNGGDGFVVARHLYSHNYAVLVLVLGTAGQMTGDAAWNYQIIQRMGIPTLEITDEEKLRQGLAASKGAAGLVDALLGTGLRRPVTGLYLKAIQQFTQEFRNKPVFALDIPSGLAADSGEVLGGVLPATYTYAMGAYKYGHFFNTGNQYCGRCQSIKLGIPSQLYRQAVTCLTAASIAALRQRVAVNEHKGCFGRVAIWAGSQEMPGAALLNAQAALRTGSGIVELYLDRQTHPLLAGRVPEIIYRLLDIKDFAVQRWSTASVLLLGSGLGQSSATAAFLEKVLLELDIPLVIDADGINMLRPYLAHLRSKPVILTPHLGEMARLIEQSVAYVKQHAVAVAQHFVEKYGVCLVLKSANTIIATPDNITVYRGQNVNLATAGSGDVLAGSIASFVAQGYQLQEAACLGVWYHGQAVQGLPRDQKVGLGAGDIIKRIKLN